MGEGARNCGKINISIKIQKVRRIALTPKFPVFILCRPALNGLVFLLLLNEMHGNLGEFRRSSAAERVTVNH